mmetsp:Transcript_71921/g.156679  ORF Transcript_71921/g.156679 Transcript_71921/m.156679 type:complete len:336 (-) Transcript_71921:351-1358(-)
MGRIRQKTRMAPFKSSTVLWSFFRLNSASSTSASLTPMAKASAIAAASISLASRTESTSFMSQFMLSPKALVTPARSSFCFFFFSMSFSTSPHSEAGKPASLAFCKASSNSASFWLSMAASIASLASCFGSSSFRMASASEILPASKPAVLACSMAHLRSAMTRDFKAAAKPCSAFSLFSAPANISSHSLISSSETPAFLALAMAVFISLASPEACAAVKPLRASSFGSSTFRTLAAASISALASFNSLAVAMAVFRPSTSLSLMASRRAWRASCLVRSSLTFSWAVFNSSSVAPAAWHWWITASNSFGESTVFMTTSNFRNDAVLSSSSSLAAS